MKHYYYLLVTTVAIIFIFGHEDNLDNFRIMLGEAKENHQRQDTFVLYTIISY